MKQFIYYILVASALCFVNACNTDEDPAKEEDNPAEPIPLTLRQGEKVNADNRFAFTVL